MLDNKTLEGAMKVRLDNEYPDYPKFEEGIRRAPDRGFRLTKAQTKIALKNALRYVPEELHESWLQNLWRSSQLAAEFMLIDTDLRAEFTENRSTNIKANASRARHSRL